MDEYIVWEGRAAAEGIGILYSTDGIRPFELYIETLSRLFEKKTCMLVFDPYTAREGAEGHTTFWACRNSG